MDSCLHRLTTGSFHLWIREILPSADLIDPLQETLAELVKMLPSEESDGSADMFYTTGEPSVFRGRVAKTIWLGSGRKACGTW